MASIMSSTVVNVAIPGLSVSPWAGTVVSSHHVAVAVVDATTPWLLAPTTATI